MKMEKYFHKIDSSTKLCETLRTLWLITFLHHGVHRVSQSKIYLYLIILFPFTLFSQTPDSTQTHYTQVFEIPTDATDFTLDKLGNTYLITPDNDLVKYNKKGELLFRYSDNTLGKLGSVDASNPMQILLYYPDFLIVKTLDRTLNPTGEVTLTDFITTQNAIICSSNDNNIWVFDIDNQQLKKINRVGKIVYESGDLRLVVNQKIMPNRMEEKAYKLYINVPDEGEFIFDNFGKYIESNVFPTLRK